MKWYGWLLVALLVVEPPPVTAQATWEAIFRALIDEITGSAIIESGREYNGSLYSAMLRFIITEIPPRTPCPEEHLAIDLHL